METYSTVDEAIDLLGLEEVLRRLQQAASTSEAFKLKSQKLDTSTRRRAALKEIHELKLGKRAKEELFLEMAISIHEALYAIQGRLSSIYALLAK